MEYHSRKILDALYSFADIERPTWLNSVIVNTSKEYLQDGRRGLIRQLLIDLINDNYLKNRHRVFGLKNRD